MYAIIDLETTGGKFNEEGITEIAIYRFDGQEITDQFISLVNPEIPIHPYVTKLTGIKNSMLRSAPKFYEIAKRIVEITQDCTLVAHNAGFDYRVLQLEFRRLGYDFQMPSICTVELSKQLLPDAETYSLGKLARSLGIPVADRHRAFGDALATLKLFKLLLEKDQSKEIVKQSVKTILQKEYAPKLFNILERLPSTTGVFYVYDYNQSIIYIGKATNIRKKVSQLFTSDSKLGKRIQQDVGAITFEETGNELLAILKEKEEISIIKPTLNTLQKKPIFIWSLYWDDNENPTKVIVDRTDNRRKVLESFKHQKDALEYANKINKLKNIELIKEHFKEQKVFFNQLIIIMKGRAINEKTALVIKNNKFEGYCFFDLNYQIRTEHILNQILIPLTNKDTMNIIKNYLATKNDYKLL